MRWRWRRLTPISSAYGMDSFQAHLEAAKARGMKLRILRRPGLAHDLDTPEEYRRYAKENCSAQRQRSCDKSAKLMSR